MKICVLIKQVASEDSNLVLNNDKLTLDNNALNLVSNEPDVYALEEALQIKEKIGGEVKVCTMGPESSRQVIKDALAKGADSGIFILNNNTNSSSPQVIAKTISDNIRDEKFDLILSGLQSNDMGYSQVGLLVSEYLKTSHASLVMGTEINNNTIKVKLELENGWFQWSELDLPACLTIQSGINTPRYATLKGIMSVKNKPVETFKNIAENDFGYKVLETFIPTKSKETIKIEGNSDEIVEELIDVLKNNVKVI